MHALFTSPAEVPLEAGVIAAEEENDYTSLSSLVGGGAALMKPQIQNGGVHQSLIAIVVICRYS